MSHTTNITAALSALLLSISLTVQAESMPDETKSVDVEKVEVRGIRHSLVKAGQLKDVVEHTEILAAEALDDARAINLTEALQSQPGIVIANECSMCGYKRIQLNGLKAEHTTILIDGLPTHTIVSGFYAVDSIAMTGVDRIEIARGAGAALTAPEAIGGIVNIVTVEKEENTAQFDISVGENGYSNIGLLATTASLDKNFRSTFVFQKDKRDQFDGDNNGLSENPYLENQSATARASWDINKTNNFVFRVSKVDQEMFGGPVLGKVIANKEDAFNSVSLGESPDLFIDGNVNNQFIGNAWESTEWIRGKRNEFSFSWLNVLNDNLNVTFNHSQALHRQNSFYEGFDYFAKDTMYYHDIRFNYSLNNQHLLTFGADQRDESMRSKSQAGEAVNQDGNNDTLYVSDSFNYDVSGLFLQDSWLVNDNLDVNLALRLDHVVADFVDPSKPGTEIAETIVSPRADIRLLHNDFWTSRFSIGRGYRAPLSFFESDHGILDASVGFSLAIDKLERSITTGYSLTYDSDRLKATSSISRTAIDNLSILSETKEGVPLLTQLTHSAEVTSLDFAGSYTISPALTLNITGEQFWFSNEFKHSYAIATTERQINISLDWETDSWDNQIAMSWLGARNLQDYSYKGYNDKDLSDLKSQQAPSFFWIDIRAENKLRPNLSIYFGANNLLNLNQAKDFESPLYFTPDGKFDVSYIYAPLRGREFYAGVKMVFN